MNETPIPDFSQSMLFLMTRLDKDHPGYVLTLSSTKKIFEDPSNPIWVTVLESREDALNRIFVFNRATNTITEISEADDLKENRTCTFTTFDKKHKVIFANYREEERDDYKIFHLNEDFTVVEKTCIVTCKRDVLSASRPVQKAHFCKSPFIFLEQKEQRGIVVSLETGEAYRIDDGGTLQHEGFETVSSAEVHCLGNASIPSVVILFLRNLVGNNNKYPYIVSIFAKREKNQELEEVQRATIGMISWFEGPIKVTRQPKGYAKIEIPFGKNLKSHFILVPYQF